MTWATYAPIAVIAVAPAGDSIRIAVDDAGVDRAALVRALALRSPGLRIVEGTQTDVALLRVSARGADFMVIVALPDGRVYERTVSAASADAPRVIATAAANLLGAVLDRSADAENVAPTPEHVDAQPELTIPDAPASATQPGQVPPAAPAREVAQTEPVAAPTPESAAAPAEGPIVANEASPTPPPRSRPRALRLAIEPSVAVGLGPDAADAAMSGLGGRIRFGVSIGAWSVDAGATYQGWQKRGSRLLVVGGQVGVGHLWQRRRFEVETRAVIGVSGWRATADAATVVSSEAPVPGVLVRVGVGVSPLWWFGSGRVGAGPLAECAYAGEPRARWATGRVAIEGRDAAWVVGGAQLLLGVRIAFRFAPARGRRDPPGPWQRR